MQNRLYDDGLPETEIVPPLGDAELTTLLYSALSMNNIPMDVEINVIGIKFSLLALNHGEVSAASQACKNFDIYTHDLEYQRSLLARSITKLNGAPVRNIAVVDSFLRKCPFTVVEALFVRFIALRKDQEKAVGEASEALKKEPPSPLNESAGASPSTSEPSLGTQG